MPFSEARMADFRRGDVGAPFERGESPFALFEVEDVPLSGRIMDPARRLRLGEGWLCVSRSRLCSPLPCSSITGVLDWSSEASGGGVDSRRRRRRREGWFWMDDCTIDGGLDVLRLRPGRRGEDVIFCLSMALSAGKLGVCS